MAVSESDFDRFRERVVGRRVNEQTYGKYERWVKRFETWRSGEDIDVGVLIDFDTVLEDETWADYPWTNDTGRPAPASYSYRSRIVAISAIKLWANFYHGAEITEEVQNIVSGEPDPFDPPYISRNDIARVIRDAEDACSNPDCTAALAVTYDAVLRASELTLLTTDDIDLDQGTIYVHATKGSESGTLSLGERARSALRDHVDRNNPSSKLFTNAYGNGWKPSSWADHVRTQHHEVGSHSIGRHSPIVHMLQHPAEFEHIDESQDVFGQVYQRARHRHPTTTSRYAKIVGMDVPDWGE